MKKIEVFLRHCFYSRASIYKARFKKFSHEKCHNNLMATADFSKVNFTFFLDTHFGNGQDHFIKKQDRFPIVEIDAGCEAKSFLAQLDYAIRQNFDDDTILYFLEDDYLHREGWVDVLLEAFTVPNVDYVTLFDDRDKYEAELYKDLTAKLFFTETSHWRTTPATTNTYAMRFKTLKNTIDIHREFSLNRDISSDYDKFCKLTEMGQILISPIPGHSTHVQLENMSSCYDWEPLLETKGKSGLKLSLKKLLAKSPN